MVTENGEICCLEKKRKKKHINNYPKLLVGDKVEVRSLEKEYEGSWHLGTVIACEYQSRWVQYDHRLCIDGSNKLIRTVNVPPIIDGIISATKIQNNHRSCIQIRPLPPPLNVIESTLHYGQCVDAYHDEANCEGVIFDDSDGFENRLVYFPDTGNEMYFTSNNLRITQDWDEFSGHWKPRKNWFFLDLIEEFKQEWPLQVSVKHIWSEVKQKEAFRKQLKRWTSMGYGLWRNLVWEAFSDNFKFFLKHFLKKPNFLGDEACKTSLLFSEASFDAIFKPKSHSSSSKTPGGNPRCVSKKRKHTWLPASGDIVPGPEFCPDSVTEFIRIYNCKERPSLELRQNLRKHLLFLEWKIEFRKVNGIPIFMYTSHEGKSYGALLKVCEILNAENSDWNSESKIEDSSCNGSKDTPIKKRRNRWEWGPADRHFVPEAEFCPDAIREFNLHLETRKRAPKSLILNVRKHLSFLGWKIEFMRYKGAPKLRYTSPDGTSFVALSKALHNLYKATDNFLVPYLTIEKIVPKLSDRPPPSPPPNEPGYCPEAIEQYYLLSSVKSSDYGKTFQNPKNNKVKMKAKEHLAALGWSFLYYTRGSGKQEIHYISKSGKKYGSLRAACKGCIDEGVLYVSNSFSPVVNKSKNVYEDEQTLAQSMLNSKSIEVEIKDIASVRKRGKKRRNSVTALHSHLLQKTDKNVKVKHLRKRKKSTSLISIENISDDCSKSAKRSCKKSLKEVEATLSLLIDNNVVFPRKKVHYVSKEKCLIGEGVITRAGIECNCCQEVFTLSNFELHVCNNNHRPEGTIFLEDGRSLLDCEMELKVTKDRWDPKKSDIICSICHYGGELMLCDQCPSAFHTKCLGLQCVPDGEWFCPPCCCGICGKCRFSRDTREFGDESVLSCDQCEHKYHVGCVRLRGVLKLENSHKQNWFCNETCEQIFWGLQKLLGKPVPVGEENITWTLTKYTDSCVYDQNNPDKEALAENYSKFNVALSVMHECFEPSRERKTRRDVVEDVIFRRRSELNRLNFQGFYTVLLEKNGEVITVATMRVHGEKVAEVPLIGTQVKYRRLGMCRMLMNELEKRLTELGVERLVLPAVPSVLNTWTESFQFSKMTKLERLNFLNYIFLDFEGTTMCQKFLREIPSPCLDHLETENTALVLFENNDLDEKSVVSEVSDPIFSIQESEPVFLIHESDPVDEIENADQGSSE